MVSEGVIEGVRTDRGVRIKRVSIKGGGGGGGFDSIYIGQSRPSDKGQGPGYPDPEIRERPVLKKYFFGPSGLSLV